MKSGNGCVIWQGYQYNRIKVKEERKMSTLTQGDLRIECAVSRMDIQSFHMGIRQGQNYGSMVQIR